MPDIVVGAKESREMHRLQWWACGFYVSRVLGFKFLCQPRPVVLKLDQASEAPGRFAKT